MDGDNFVRCGECGHEGAKLYTAHRTPPFDNVDYLRAPPVPDGLLSGGILDML